MTGLLDLSPEGGLLQQAKLFFFSGLLRASYYPDPPSGDLLFSAAGPYTYYQSTLDDPTVPNWFGLDYGVWQVLAFAGTSNVAQWAGNILGVAQVSAAPWPGMVNNYFQIAATKQLTNVLEVMGAHSALNNVVVTGHSLGGGIANLVAYAINQANPGAVKWVVTEGGVRVGNLEWALAPSWPILALRNSGDIVPYVPPQRGNQPLWSADSVGWGPCQDYYPVGDQWILTPSGGRVSERLSALAQPDTALLNQLYVQGVNPNALSHATGQYAQRISNWGGGYAGLPDYSPWGINVSSVYAFQSSFGAVDGFIWSPQFN